MRITIQRLDEKSMLPIGNMLIPSYLVHFESSFVNGQARFVPALFDFVGCIGQTFDVEVNQDSVSDFILSKHSQDQHTVVAQFESGSFLVRGLVSAAYPENDLIVVTANEVNFTLTNRDFGDIKPCIGDEVSFIAHGVSLWDVAI